MISVKDNRKFQFDGHFRKGYGKWILAIDHLFLMAAMVSCKTIPSINDKGYGAKCGFGLEISSDKTWNAPLSPYNLAAMGKIQKNIEIKVRPVGLLNINAKEQQLRCLLWKWSLLNWWATEKHFEPRHFSTVTFSIPLPLLQYTLREILCTGVKNTEKTYITILFALTKG